MIIQDSTIVALATPLGQSPLALIRVSGANTFSIISLIFKSQQDVNLASGHSVIFGYIINPKNNSTVDQVLISIFRTPRSFTGEDMVEISCHGGYIIFQEIIRLLTENGCQLAKPGEFTRRAFLNNKIDLIQAESIHDLISSKSLEGTKLALSSLKKNLGAHLEKIRNQVTSLIAKTEVHIDYSEENLEPWDSHDTQQLQHILSEVNLLKQQAQQTQKMASGYQVVIVGEPNAGKSSLLNKFLGEDKVIVSKTPGTTRDTIEATLSLFNLPVTLVDTAGLRTNPETDIEQIGIQKTYDTFKNADLILIIHDITNNDYSQINQIIELAKDGNIPFLIVLNKKDLVTEPYSQHLPNLSLNSTNYIYISCFENNPLEGLKTSIHSQLINKQSCDTQFYINQRQEALLSEIAYILEKTIELVISAGFNQSAEILSFHLQQILAKFQEIYGFDIHDSILESIFSQFCIGK